MLVSGKHITSKTNHFAAQPRCTGPLRPGEIGHAEGETRAANLSQGAFSAMGDCQSKEGKVQFYSMLGC